MNKRLFAIYHILFIAIVASISYIVLRPRNTWSTGVSSKSCYHSHQIPKTIKRVIAFDSYGDCIKFVNS